ncbi:hypothetical protein ISCGN_015809 [Ixodes scapularis]
MFYLLRRVPIVSNNDVLRVQCLPASMPDSNRVEEQSHEAFLFFRHNIPDATVFFWRQGKRNGSFVSQIVPENFFLFGILFNLYNCRLGGNIGAKNANRLKYLARQKAGFFGKY